MSEKEKGTMECPLCHKQIREDANYCPKCGFQLKEHPVVIDYKRSV